MSTIRFHLPGSRTLINGSLAVQTALVRCRQRVRSAATRRGGPGLAGGGAGVRSWTSPAGPVALVVMITAVHSHRAGSDLCLLGSRHSSYRPAKDSTPVVDRMEVVGLLAVLGVALPGRPFVVARGRDHRSLLAERAAPGWFVREGLHPCVDQPVADRRVLRPARDQPPPQIPDLPLDVVALGVGQPLFFVWSYSH